MSGFKKGRRSACRFLRGWLLPYTMAMFRPIGRSLFGAPYRVWGSRRSMLSIPRASSGWKCGRLPRCGAHGSCFSVGFLARPRVYKSALSHRKSHMRRSTRKRTPCPLPEGEGICGLMRTYLLIGNYGVGNVGDEALKEYFLQRFPEIEWVVLSANPEHVEIPRLPFGIRSFFTPWWRTLLAYWQCNGVVFGGGSLFTDTESSLAPVLWWWHAVLAAFIRKPVFLAFQGVGPFRTRRGEWCARWVGRRAALLSVRDVLSLARVERWNLNKKCILSFDPVFSLMISKNIRLCPSFAAIPVDAVRSKILLIIPRGNSSREFWDRSEKMRGEGWEGVRVQEPRSLSELSAFISSSSFLLTQRYHAGIVALVLGVSFEAVPQVLGDKFDALNHEDRDLVHLRERVRGGEEALRNALLS